MPGFAKCLVALFIFIATSILEFFLALLYAAFFVNDPSNAGLPLGLPQATVRVFLIGTLLLITMLFALLPDPWGNNKAVILLFGFIATVISFYFGSRALTGSGDAASASAVHLTIDPRSKTLSKATPTNVLGKLDPTYTTVLGSPVPPMIATLQSSNAQPTVTQAIGAVDNLGTVEFDFSSALAAATLGTYIVRVQSPSNVVCDERITLAT